MHAEFDNYQPDLLLPDVEKSGSLSSYRMVPPRKCKYYFMSDSKIIISSNQDQEECKLIDFDKCLRTCNVITDVSQQIIEFSKENISHMK